MPTVELIMPKMGESIIEATILSWSKAVGDAVEVDETVLEIATDKVDSEVPSPVAGVLSEIRFDVDAVVPVGEVIAVIDTGAGADVGERSTGSVPAVSPSAAVADEVLTEVSAPLSAAADTAGEKVPRLGSDGRFYSPLVRKIAEEENISTAELDALSGSGREGRVNKQDVLDYLSSRSRGQVTPQSPAPTSAPAVAPTPPAPPTPIAPGTEVVEMDRMRRLIADHMVASVQTSPHVTSFVEADVTHMWRWREANKDKFQRTHGEKITFTPIFIEAVTKAIQDFPMINVSVSGKQILVHKQINIGMAAALPSGNLIVPVIKEANLLSLTGLTKNVNDLANRARANKLKPEDIQGGTFTVTNVGTFGNVMGTPIINQPQVAILATGAIRKRPAVLETAEGDVIAIRHMMFLSLSYDHRVVDGFLGGSFLRRVADYLEAFDLNRSV